MSTQTKLVRRYHNNEDWFKWVGITNLILGILMIFISSNPSASITVWSFIVSGLMMLVFRLFQTEPVEITN